MVVGHGWLVLSVVWHCHRLAGFCTLSNSFLLPSHSAPGTFALWPYKCFYRCSQMVGMFPTVSERCCLELLEFSAQRFPRARLFLYWAGEMLSGLFSFLSPLLTPSGGGSQLANTTEDLLRHRGRRSGEGLGLQVPGGQGSRRSAGLEWWLQPSLWGVCAGVGLHVAAPPFVNRWPKFKYL